MADRRPLSWRPRVPRAVLDLRSRARLPPAAARGVERWGRTTIPRPRLLGLLAGILGLLLLLPLSWLLFGGTDLGADGPAPNPYFEQ